MIRSLIALSLLAASGLSQARGDSALEPVYAEAGQYTATLSAGQQHWRLAPIAGTDIEIRSAELCPRTATPPRGLWLLGRDDAGRPELVAPSATLLPNGHRGRVALRSCDDPELRSARVEAYGVPQRVLDLLAAEAGAVLVND
jgi:hypothetical protein